MKRKKKIIIFSIIIINLILIISIGILIFINSKNLKIILKKDRAININDKAYNTDFIKKVKNGRIISNKKLIDTSKLGDKKITIKIKNYFNKVNNFTYKVKIVDKIPPKIEFKNELSITEGTSIDLLKETRVTDNSQEEIKVSIEGNYDINKPNDYELYYIAKDSSGNETKEKFILKVKKKEISNTNNTQDRTFTTSKGYKGYTKDGITYINDILIVNKTYSIPSTYSPNNLTSDTRDAMNKMFADASSVGLNIYLSSGFRSYYTQKSLYNNYVAIDGKENADTYSARPGHSEHQTGLAFDVNQVDNSFDNTNEAIWLSNNCYKYGFILRYPKGKTNETGYMYESWHFRYVGQNLASKLYNNGDWITLESYFGIESKYNY